ncbi:ABC transporter ATP-binding protein [Sphingomonas alba]|uniref:ABC transporter ATP-binding protein n=1 Tax=Sphingomonas alba TaxID=2908208 RepID=A0ABT0RIZ0_9SPHN|nr:ABC transporter ATP-binding protein [Sphingomonas alba]MCL6682570.1 ABC transporter ATP-binding protein [Sphingomonas alba]
MSRLVASNLCIPGRLEQTSLEVDAGTLTCLIGPNGSGKTSLLHAIAGIGTRDGGVRIDGVDPWRAPPSVRPRLITFFPASRDVKWPLTASDVIRLGGEGEIGPVIADLDLEAFANRRIDQLSTGERTRVLIARALAPRPRVALLDEPVANLDPLWQLKLMEHLRTLASESGQTVIIAAHDLDLAGRFADRLIMMSSGRIVADGGRDLLESGVIGEIFGVERRDGAWQPLA